jgi:hypothetical protein
MQQQSLSVMMSMDAFEELNGALAGQSAILGATFPYGSGAIATGQRFATALGKKLVINLV